MSELKIYSQCYDGTNGLFYLKDEADKVIADLEESHKKEVGQLLMEIVKLKDKTLQYKVLHKEKCRDINTQERFFALEIAHQKYKRCLAMAKLAVIDDYLPWNMKWHKRWRDLAEKFKEAK